jgi:hypothetical protein
VWGKNKMICNFGNDSKDDDETCMPVVFIHYPYSNPHPSQMGRLWVENNYTLKKWGG